MNININVKSSKDVNLLLFKNYLIENEKQENTIEKYVRDVNEYLSWTKNNNHRNITKRIVLEYKEYLKNKHKERAKSINSKISSLNSYFMFCKRNDLKLKIIKCQKSIFGNKDKELTKKDLYRLLEEAKSNKKLYYLILTIVSTGIRVSELKYIKVSALKEGKAEVFNKGKVRPVRIPKKLCKELLDYCKKEKIISGSIFITKNGKPLHRSYIWSLFKKLSEKSGVEVNRVFPHNLRHLFAKAFYKETKDIVKLASILGHSSIETTRIYTLVNEEEIIEDIENLRFIHDT